MPKTQGKYNASARQDVNHVQYSKGVLINGHSQLSAQWTGLRFNEAGYHKENTHVNHHKSDVINNSMQTKLKR